MRLTIVPSDKTVIVDGVPREVDCSGFASCQDTHAVQWDGTKGHVEWMQTGEPYKSNTALSSIDQYQEVINAWTAAAPVKKAP